MLVSIYGVIINFYLSYQFKKLSSNAFFFIHLGLRLGKVVAKVGLVTILRQFEFECAEDKEIEFDNFAVTLSPKGGVEMKVRRRVVK